jgi:hypothetical protein
MSKELGEMELRARLAERQAALALDALQVVHSKLGALEALAIELARRADLDASDADMLIERMGASASPAPARNLRQELMRLLHQEG